MIIGKKELLKYIKYHRLMQLATSSKNMPWICNVFYAFDGKNFYFISNPSGRHCKDIKNNKNVACAITDSDQKVTGKKSGLQIHGFAVQLKSDKEIKYAFDLWNKANPGLEKDVNIDSLRKGELNDMPYMIKPIEIKFFNERLYGSKAVKIFRVR